MPDNKHYSFYSPNFGEVNLNLVNNGDDSYTMEMIDRFWFYSCVTGSGTFTIHSGSGILGNIIFNHAKPSSVISVFDGLDVSGSKIARIEHGATGQMIQQYQLNYNVKVENGITIQASDSDDITITHRGA